MFDDESIAAALAAEPDIAECFNRIMASMEVLDHEFDQLQEFDYEDRLMGAVNAMIRFLLAIGDAMDGANLKPGREELRAKLLARQPTKVLSDFDLGHARAIRVAAAYNAGVRLNASGSKDTRCPSGLVSPHSSR